ncbi:hypothetical protein [Spirosoma foliorum]|uniref:Uncharacterized protein n=1 Tax=Spirosoma foliorum TaxID=2710596 RepID=A0A7G5GS46_9BACT|nr:hypothetical protein [Spirosoma foliorum]QMW01688.1 hypothetical protein H3H32_27610 [Spirosoma foliorum]
MEVEIRFFNGSKAWAQVIDWGSGVFDEEETWGWPAKRVPFLASVDGRLYQRGYGGYFYALG